VITISESASSKLAVLKKEENQIDEAFLRVEVKKGGCSGMTYKMNFDTESRSGDKVFESNGQKVVVDPQSLLYILGMTLEYSGGLNGKGFVFNNPNASKNCGCGSSFNV
jgi:iron-sulfur cluster assembly protein